MNEWVNRKLLGGGGDFVSSTQDLHLGSGGCDSGMGLPPQSSPAGSAWSHLQQILPEVTPPGGSFTFPGVSLPLLRCSDLLLESLTQDSWLKGYPPAAIPEPCMKGAPWKTQKRRTWVGGWNVWGVKEVQAGKRKSFSHHPVPRPHLMTLGVIIWPKLSQPFLSPEN